MKGIITTKGKIVTVDDEDFEHLSKRKWCSKGLYAQGGTRKERVYLHRYLMGAKKGDVIDHINLDPSDCRKANLRFATTSGNNSNRVKSRRGSTSKFKGVCWNKSNAVWHAQITSNRKQIYLGTFKDEVEAALAYNEAALRLHGEFANLNKIPHSLHELH